MHYIETYTNIDFRAHPELYRIGIGEQGVLMAEPYKGEILPHWRFKTPEIATESALIIFGMFIDYQEHEEFVGADMAVKFLRMGFTRSRRYANHPSGTKYAPDGSIKPQDPSHFTSEKAQSAAIFKEFYDEARVNPDYLAMKARHKVLYEENLKKSKI